jgi:periplasmic copper chaperone A
MMKHLYRIAFALAVSLATAPAFAQQFKAGDIVVEQPWTRATPKGAEVAAGYLVVHNNGAEPDRLTGGSTDFANAVEVHEMSMANGVMKMRQAVDGVEIPAKGSLALKPSGYHLMFQGLKRQLMAGETVKATLTFQHAGAVEVDFKVNRIGAMKPSGDSMGGMKM